MKRHDVIARLKASEPDLRARGVEALYLYGSYARNEAQMGSDIDILVDLEPGLDLAGYMAPYLYLEGQFPSAEIGYGTRDDIVSHYRSYIEESAIRIF